MLRKMFLLMTFLLVACAPQTPAPTATSPLKTVTYEIVGQPELDSIHFTTADGKTFSAEEIIQAGTDPYVPNQLEGSPGGLWVEANGEKWIATESYSSDCTQGWVTLTRNGQEVYRIETGHCSPMSPLQGLWTYDNHWVLETNHYLDEAPFNGKISQDGIVLNDKDGYDEAFGFQTLNGRPFYFFKKNGKIDAWFDGQVMSLGYDTIPHYACCSEAELNPHKFKNMTAFFATQGEKWYYVQIGTADAFK